MERLELSVYLSPLNLSAMEARPGPKFIRAWSQNKSFFSRTCLACVSLRRSLETYTPYITSQRDVVSDVVEHKQKAPQGDGTHTDLIN
jgi:hypothetical protein